jgi:hypothetical protein
MNKYLRALITGATIILILALLGVKSWSFEWWASMLILNYISTPKKDNKS